MPYIRNAGNMKSQTEIRHFFGRAVCGRQGGSETTPKLRQNHQSIKTSSTRRYIPQNKKWNFYNTIIIARKKHKRNPGCQLDGIKNYLRILSAKRWGAPVPYKKILNLI